MSQVTRVSPEHISPEATAIKSVLANSFKLRFFLWQKLPSAFWSGLRLDALEYEQATASVPYKRFTQNPFRSTYFACLAMAAEFSTGVLGMMAVQGTPTVALLVVGLRAEFKKKATGRTYFTCTDGAAVFAAVAATRLSGEAIQVETTAIGRNNAGEEVATFYITWSFKARKK